MLPDRLTAFSLTDRRVIRILDAALEAVEPAALVRRCLTSTALPSHSRCYLLGMGKAAEAMTRGAAESLGAYEAALVITKSRADEPTPRSTVIESGHPVPDERSVAAGQAAMEFVSGLETEDLLICLISGGGSALATSPVPGVSLGDLQALTAAALNSGADIEDVNNLRRCLDRLKGGGLAAATKAHVLGLILSDVIGDRTRCDCLRTDSAIPDRPYEGDPTAGEIAESNKQLTREDFEGILPRVAGNSAGGRIRQRDCGQCQNGR